MPYNPDIHHRRSIRLPGYDYAQPGAYFVTLCTQQRECLFGEIMDGAMRLNDAGRIVAREWCRTAALRQNLALDAWVVMPNHLHGILVIPDGRGTMHRVPTMERFGQPVSGSIPTVIRSFKAAVSRHLNRLHGTPAAALLWQRNYWEHVIRDEADLHRIREYIQNNPACWELDALHPTVSGGDV